jgi:hypothetical protein
MSAMVLRADPWMPEYGMGFDVAIEEPHANVDPFVETGDWSSPRIPKHVSPGPIWFVDGVRRVEMRLLADQDGRQAPGLFGSYAVGSVRCEGRAECHESVVCRAVVIGGGLRPDMLTIDCGGISLVFEPTSEPATEPHRPLWRLQELMRAEEGSLAARVAGGSDALVLADGPLNFFDPTRCPVVGVVKRFARAYLDEEQGELLPHLTTGQRTPLFALGDETNKVQRYAWYAQLTDRRPPWHDYAGIVRCEIRAGIGLDQAVLVADRVTALLPVYVGRPWDPRTPQSLAPVAGLESWLRHRLGDSRLIRRALLGWLTTLGEGH